MHTAWKYKKFYHTLKGWGYNIKNCETAQMGKEGLGCLVSFGWFWMLLVGLGWFWMVGVEKFGWGCEIYNGSPFIRYTRYTKWVFFNPTLNCITLNQLCGIVWNSQKVRSCGFLTNYRRAGGWSGFLGDVAHPSKWSFSNCQIVKSVETQNSDAAILL